MKSTTILSLVLGFILLSWTHAAAQHYGPHGQGGQMGGYHMGPGTMGPGYGYGYGPGHGRQYWGPGPGGLTQEQQEVYSKVYNKHADKIYNFSRQIREKKFMLQDELHKDKINERNIAALINEINRLRSKQYEAKVQMMIELRKSGLPIRGLGSGMMEGLEQAVPGEAAIGTDLGFI